MSRSDWGTGYVANLPSHITPQDVEAEPGKLLVKQVTVTKEMTATGIHIPMSAKGRKMVSTIGKVIKSGCPEYPEGTWVLFGDFAGCEIYFDCEKEGFYRMLFPDNILLRLRKSFQSDFDVKVVEGQKAEITQLELPMESDT